MKGNLKQKLFAIILSAAMILTSINIQDIFNKNINAAIEVDETYFNFTGSMQTYTIPQTGYYILDVYGGMGGDDTQEFWDNFGSEVEAGQGGKGGHVRAKCYFTTGTILYINVGKMGNNGATHNGGATANYGHANTYGGGAAGIGPNTGDGGGATDIRINGNSLQNRVLVAGGGGGGSHYQKGLAGGAATSGNNGTLQNGSSPSSYGGGGGGGYYGGTPGANNSTSAKGGSNYFDKTIGTLMENESGVNDGNGYAVITYCQDYSLIIDPNGGVYQNSETPTYKVKDNSSSTVTNFAYTGNYKTYTVPEDGVYKLETWGAQGGADGGAVGGLGGYVSGYVQLNKGDILYVYVGQSGIYSANSGGWNGGGYDVVKNGNGSGGGATDIRLNGTGNGYSTTTDNRIIVAGGGGGAGGGSPWINGGAGGGSKTTNTKFQGGNQTNSSYNAGGGGGGYYGGAAGTGAAGNSTNGGKGGTNFFDTKYGVVIANQAGQRSDNGYARISFMPSSEIIYTPTREGYTFAGWDIAGNGILSGNIFDYGKGTTTLTAKWTKNATASTLTINPNGGIYEDSKENTVISANSGTTKTITTPEREGYRFTGWSKTGGGSFSGNTFTYNTTDATLTANWELITASLTIKPNTGLYNGSTNDVYEDNLVSGDIKNITTPTKKGYTFREWLITGTGAYFDEKGFHMGETDIILTAQYDINQYTLTVKPNGGTWNNSSSNSSYTMDYNSTKSIPTPVAPDGYIFAGWSLSGTEASMTSLTGASTFKMGTANATLTANYAEDIVDLDVNTIVNGVSYSSGFDGIIFDVYINGVLEKSGTKDFCVRDTYKYGYTYEIKNIKSPGYSFDTSSIVKGTLTADTIVTLKFTARTDTVYKVNHYQMNTDGSTYTLKETENLAGTTDTNVTPAVKTYTGFTSPSTQTVKIKGDGTTVVNYYYTRNKYTVTYIDVVNSITGTQFGKSTDSLYYGETATGATKGTDATDNKYYNGYYYSSCTTATVTTSGATVYRIFKLRTIDISGSVNWNDKSNSYDSRPSNVTVTLFKDGTKVDSVTGLTGKDNNTFSFTGLQKYDTSTGKAYVYTVFQSNVESQNNPEDKYTTDVDATGFNFTNTLGNTTKENPDPEWVGFEVSGSIIWDDYEDQFGTRPSEVIVTLYQNDVVIKTQVIDKNTTGYSFVNLDKYDDDLNPYTYKVEEVFTAKTLTWNATTKQYEEIDAYAITVDGFDFTNTLVDTEEKPIIPVKPDHINTLTIKLDFNDNINWTDIEKKSSEVTSFVTLKQMETVINNGTVSYTSNYNGMEYKAVVNNTGVTINNIPSGKYEIVESNDNTFILEGIDLQTNSSISVVNENDKWYLIISETNQNQTGIILLNMNIDSFNGVDDSMVLNNLYSLENTSTTQVMMLSMFSDEVTVPEYVEPITYTITYKDCDVVDDTKYSENSEATLKDCEMEGFLGWSEDSETIEPQYIAGDKVKLEKDLILYPVIEAPESTEENSSEKIESKEQEETTETESTLEEEISEVDESTETVETETEEEIISEEEPAEKQEESSEIEETTESEEIESSAFSE